MSDELTDKSAEEQTRIARALIGRAVRVEKITGRAQNGDPVKAGPFAAIVTGYDSFPDGRVAGIAVTVFMRNSQQFAVVYPPSQGDLQVGSWVEC